MAFAKGHEPWNKGKSLSPELREKLSKAHKGIPSGMKGKHHAPEAIEKNRKHNQGRSPWHKGKKLSDEIKQKLSESHRGKPSSRKGLKASDETRHRLSQSHMGNKSALGHTLSDESKKKISDSLIGKLVSDKNPNWRGGKSFEPYCKNFTQRLRENVRDSFGRKCVICGIGEVENGRKLDIHHCDYNKGQGCGHKWNLVPLCVCCHRKSTHNRHYYFNLLANYWAMNPDINFSF